MAVTPRSERSQTRFSTPEPDLDDHRYQPESLPVATGERYPSARRGTLASIASAERPRIDHTHSPDMAHHGSIARDFEQAVVEDDDASMKSTREERAGSHNAHAAARSTHRRAVQNQTRGLTGGPSKESLGSRRSTSPPNSVDAFAPPRARGRAGTLNSKHNSVDNLTLQRTASNATHPRRRPTFGEEGTTGVRTDVASRRDEVEDDVCFPTEEPTNTYTIDFEDLEEFVAQAHEKTPVAHPFMPKFAFQSDHKPRVFPNLCRSPQFNGVTNEGIDQYGDDTEKHQMTEKEAGMNSDDDADLKPQPTIQELINRFTFFSSEMDETVHAPELGGLLMPNETFRDLFELGPEGGVWWLDMLNPSEEEVIAVCNAFRVHPLTREDITTQETREKVELFKSYYFVCFRSFYAVDKESDDYLEPINVYAVVFREGLLTFSFCQNSHMANVRKRIGRLRDYVNLSADWICYALIDEIVDAFAPPLREVETEADIIEDNVFTARFEDSKLILRQIGMCRKKTMQILRLLGGKADVIKGFAKRCTAQYSVAPRGDVGLYLSDVQDHVVTMMSNASHFEKMLSRSHSNYLAQISLEHTAQGNRLNGLLGKVTLIATILVPLNLIAGLFGMNVPVPGRDSTGLGWWFGIVGVILAFTTACVLAAKRRHLI